MDKKILIHISDIHIRGYQYLDEMKFTFNELYKKIDETIEKNTDAAICIVCTGDIYHSKLTVTNEYFDAAFDFFRELSNRAPLVIIPGNHDLSLPNKDRMDAISPVIKALGGNTKYTITYSIKSEKWQGQFLTGEFESTEPRFYFHHFAITDPKNKWPTKKDFHPETTGKIMNVALYHGSINNSKVDSGWVSRGNKDDISLFADFDAALLGDIHISQMLTPTVGYPGSLRQNNFGETLDKGYLEWTIVDDKISTKRVVLDQKRYFLTLVVNSVEEVEDIGELPLDCRIRVKPTKEIDIVEEIKLKNKIQDLYSPCGDVAVLPPEFFGTLDSKIDVDEEIDVMHENIRDAEVQKSLIKKFFENNNLSDEDFEDLFEIDKKYHSFIKTDLMRNIKWTLQTIEWENLFSYGKGNSLDLRTLTGITAIIGKNGSGKSSILDILKLGLYNSISKEGANKNFDYVNRKCKNGKVVIKAKLNDDMYSIDRSLKKVGKVQDEKIENEIDFTKVEKSGKKKILNGETKPDTNAAIRDVFGTSDDFDVTSLSSQFGLSKFIDARGTERKKTISKFVDLEIFDEKYKLAIEDFKDAKSQLKLFDLMQITKNIELYKSELEIFEVQEQVAEGKIQKLKSSLTQIEKDLLKNNRKISNFEFNVNKKDLIEQIEELTKTKEEKSEILNKLFIDLEVKINTTKKYELSKLLNDLHLQKVLESQLIKGKSMLEKNKKTALLIAKIPNENICKKCPLAENAYAAEQENVLLVSNLKEMTEDYNSDQFQDIQKKIDMFLTLEADKKAIQFYVDSIELLEEKLEKLNQELILCEQNEVKIQENLLLEQKIQVLIQSKKDCEKQFLEKDKELKEIQRKTAVAEANIKHSEEKLVQANALGRKYFLYQLYIEAMGKDGISYWIISKKIPIINRILNKILSQIWNLKIELVNDEEEKTLKIYCSDEDGKRPIELLSGAEKAVASLALRTAFWYISSLPKSPILILDESFSFIENDKIDAVLKALTYLKNYFENIIIITHNDELKSYCDHVLYVQKKQGYSRISE